MDVGARKAAVITIAQFLFKAEDKDTRILECSWFLDLNDNIRSRISRTREDMPVINTHRRRSVALGGVEHRVSFVTQSTYTEKPGNDSTGSDR